MPKMHAICNPQHCITYPELANRDLLDVMKRCLDRDPKARITLQVRLPLHHSAITAPHLSAAGSCEFCIVGHTAALLLFLPQTVLLTALLRVWSTGAAGPPLPAPQQAECSSTSRAGAV